MYIFTVHCTIHILKISNKILESANSKEYYQEDNKILKIKKKGQLFKNQSLIWGAAPQKFGILFKTFTDMQCMRLYNIVGKLPIGRNGMNMTWVLVYVDWFVVTM
jgi:hypothetical protein